MLHRLVLSLSKVKWFSILSLFVIAALILSAVQPVLAQESPPAPHGIRYDAPPYAVDGPYAVGVRYFTIPAVGENDRELTATVWYPAEPPEAETPPMVYEQQFAPGDVPPFSVLGQAQLDAPPDASGAPYPLVVYSHAHWSMGQEVPYFVEHLASRGFVVIAVDHEDNWSTWGATGFGPMDYPTPVRRAQEVTRQIDFAEKLSAADGELAGMINTETVGVAGWSMGGTTSLAAAGAQLDLANLRTWCEADPLHAQAASWVCIDVLSHEEELAAFAGLDEVPAGLWPATKDERVAAAVQLSGDAVLYGSEGLAAVDVPVMLFLGGEEEITDPAILVGDPYASVASPRKAEVVFDHGGHMVFFSSCDNTPDIVAIGYPMFCSDPVWDMDRAHDLINHFATAFLLDTLKGDAAAAAALMPENVAFPGVTYEATGYEAAAPEQAAGGVTAEAVAGYVDNNGVKIYYEVEGEGPPLVLVHWASGSTQDWRLFGYVDALKDDYRLILIDMRGHGKSDKPDDPAAYDAATQASDIVAVLDELGIEQANYFGYSLGGRLGWALAKYAPERFQSLIIGGHIPFVWDDSEWAANMLAAGPEGWADGLVSYAEALGVGHPDLHAAYAANDLEAVARASKGLNAEDLATDLPGVTVPILLLAGENDEMLPEMALAAKELPYATMAIMPGLDHGQGFMLADQALPFITDFLGKMNPPEAAPSSSLDADLSAQIEGIVQQAMTDYPAPGFEMCVLKDGAVVYSKGFGLADVAENRPVTPQSLQLQASISKSMTAAAIMQLAEQGQIDLDAPVSDYLPYFAMADDRYQAITVRMLLSHRSGMPDSPARWTEPLDQTMNPLEQAVRDLGEMELLFAPGEGWSYSSYGYSVLGAIIAAVTGKAYESYMAEQWLAPLGMTQSTFVTEDVDPAARMTGYISDEEGKATPTDVACDGRKASGCTLWSSCEDMVKYAQFMLNQGEVDGSALLQPATIEAMWTPASETGWAEMNGPRYGPPLQAYGLGWVLGEVDGHRLVGHPGGTDGYNSQILLAPDDGLAVLAMDNWLDLAAIPAFPASFAATDVMYALLGIEPEAAPTAQLDEGMATKIEDILTTTMEGVGVPGYAMCVVNSGNIVYNKGFGVAELGSEQPVTPQSVFSIRSTTKSFTITALMQLVEQGKIDLDAPVTTYLPDFKMADPRYKDITVRMLASHTSGLNGVESWENMPPRSEEPQNIAAAIKWFVRSLADDKLSDAPPTAWQYADDNFILLADIIGTVAAEPYDAYVTTHLLEPLRMTHTAFDAAALSADALVGEHVTNAEGVVTATPHSNYGGFDAPAGGLFSTCEDMTRWMQVHLNRGELDGVRILQPETYDLMWTPQVETGMAEFFGQWMANMALGWGVGEDASHLFAGHSGGGDGQNIGYELAPNDNVGVTVLANWGTEPMAFPAWTAAADVLYLLLGIEPAAQSSKPEAPASQLDPDLTAQIDAMIEETMARIDLPGFALAVVKDGAVAYAKGYGVTSLDGGEPVTSQTVFQWAENSMSLTAMAVLQLVEEGKLDLDAPVTDYVPYFKLADDRYKEITVGQILAHTSGIPDSGDRMADWENFLPEYDGGALERWVRNDLAEKGLLFAPGEGWEYSDLAYALLGAVIGAASGQPYEAYMAEHILAPLGMDKSTFLLEEVDKTLLAGPHVPNAEGEVVATKAMPYHRPFAATNNLFAISSILAKLALASLSRGALGDQRILPEDAYDFMWTATSPTPFADFPFGRVYPATMMLDWGNGWFLGDIAGHPAPNSYGGENGFNADMVFVPDANLAVIAVGNSQAMDEFYAPDIAVDVAAMLLENIEPQ